MFCLGTVIPQGHLAIFPTLKLVFISVISANEFIFQRQMIPGVVIIYRHIILTRVANCVFWSIFCKAGQLSFVARILGSGACVYGHALFLHTNIIIFVSDLGSDLMCPGSDELFVTLPSKSHHFVGFINSPHSNIII